MKISKLIIELKSIPENTTLLDDDFSYQRTFFTEGEDTLVGAEMFVCNSVLIDKKRYPELKDYFSKVKRATIEKIVFEKAK